MLCLVGVTFGVSSEASVDGGQERALSVAGPEGGERCDEAFFW